MDKPSLQSIPPEMQAAIVSYISRPSDLKSLSLTCEQLRAVATEKLYHAVYLDLSVVTCESGFFAINHRGHPHIRSLAVCCRPTSRNGIEMINKDVRLALQLIPRNVLKEFWTSQDLKLEPETLTLLLTQQMALESLCLSKLRSIMNKVPIDLVACVPKLRNFTAHFSNGAKSARKISEFYEQMIRGCRQLKCLEIRANHDLGDIDLYEVPDYFRILGDRSCAALESFFGSEKSYAPLPLEELHLRNLYLDDPECGFNRAIQWENLGWLTLWRCEFCDELFKHLRLLLDNTQAKLRGLTYYYDGYHIVEPLCELQLFLRSFSGLEYLAIQDELGREPFHLECLSTHLASLQHLMLPENPDMSSDWKNRLAQLQVLVKQTPKLRQLGCAFPKVTARQLESGDLRQYNSIIDTIATLPHLEILHVLSFPDAYLTEKSVERSYKISSSVLKQAYLQQELDPFANSFVQRFVAKSGNNKLSTLCFGSGGGIDQVETDATYYGRPMGRIYYAIERTMGSIKAIRRDRVAMRYREPMLKIGLLDQEHDADLGMCNGGSGQFAVLR